MLSVKLVLSRPKIKWVPYIKLHMESQTDVHITETLATKYRYPCYYSTNCVIIQQTVTLSKYGHDALDICHP